MIKREGLPRRANVARGSLKKKVIPNTSQFPFAKEYRPFQNQFR